MSGHSDDRDDDGTTEASERTSDSNRAADPADEFVGRGLFEEDIGPGSAMAHLYRGEIHRMTRWRDRLDRTTRWAVIVIAAVLTWAFSAESNPHYVLLVGVAVVGIFLGIESHRYRGYDVWRSRVRTLQVNVFAYALDPGAGIEDLDWRQSLADDYRHPTVKITREEALAHRLRRVYLPLALVLLAAWIVRITAFADEPWPTSAAVGTIPGIAVSVVVAAVYLVALVVAFRPRRWRARGELLDRDIRDEQRTRED